MAEVNIFAVTATVGAVDIDLVSGPGVKGQTLAKNEIATVKLIGFERRMAIAGNNRGATNQAAPAEETIQWSADPASAESVHAIPQMGRQNQVLGILLVGKKEKNI